MSLQQRGMTFFHCFCHRLLPEFCVAQRGWKSRGIPVDFFRDGCWIRGSSLCKEINAVAWVRTTASVRVKGFPERKVYSFALDIASRRLFRPLGLQLEALLRKQYQMKELESQQRKGIDNPRILRRRRLLAVRCVVCESNSSQDRSRESLFKARVNR